MVEEQQSELDLDFLNAFKKNAKELSKVKVDFNAFMESAMITMRSTANTLLNENTHRMIVSEMKNVVIGDANQQTIARIQFLINELEEQSVIEYRDFLSDALPKDNIHTEINKLQEQAKELRKDNPNAVIPKEMIAEFDGLKALIGKLDSISDSINGVLTEGIYGDLSLDDKNMTGVFFKFMNLNKEYVEMFIREIRRIRSDSTKAIRKVTSYVDIKDNTLTTVLFLFDTEDEAMTFYSAKAMLEGVFDKYTRLSSGAKATGEFDLINHKYPEYINANLPHNNPLSGMYVDPNAPIPVSPPSKVVNEEEAQSLYDTYSEDDAFVNMKGSDFVFAGYIDEDDGENAFAIIPKDYWYESRCFLDFEIDIEHIIGSDFEQVTDSVFLYDGNFEDGKNILLGLGMKEVSLEEDEGDDVTVYPEDVLFGIKTTEESLSFRFVSRERYTNQMVVHEGELFFDSIDDATEWSVADDNEWEYKDGSPVYLKEAVDYLLAIGMTHEQELDNIKDVDDTTVQKINEFVGEKVAIANQIEEDLKVFVATQYEKVLSWKRKPSDFSVYWNGTEWKMILSSDVEAEPVRNTLDKLYNEFNKLT
jgi:hypothetical protein